MFLHLAITFLIFTTAFHPFHHDHGFGYDSESSYCNCYSSDFSFAHHDYRLPLLLFHAAGCLSFYSRHGLHRLFLLELALHDVVVEFVTVNVMSTTLTCSFVDSSNASTIAVGTCPYSCRDLHVGSAGERRRGAVVVVVVIGSVLRSAEGRGTRFEVREDLVGRGVLLVDVMAVASEKICGAEEQWTR